MDVSRKTWIENLYYIKTNDMKLSKGKIKQGYPKIFITNSII